MKCRIRYIGLRGFRSLDGVRFDLTEGAVREPRDFALVLGENGCGKSNLIDSVAFLKMTLDTLLLSELSGSGARRGAIHGEADPDEGTFHEFRVPFDVPDVPVWDVRSLADRFRTAGSLSGPEVELGFSMDGSDGRYMIRLGEDGRVAEEVLECIISTRAGRAFRIAATDGLPDATFSTSLFGDTQTSRRLRAAIRSHWGDHSFLSIVRAENIRDGGATASRLGTGIMDVISFLEDIVVVSDGAGDIMADGLDDILRQMFEGDVDESDAKLLIKYGTCLDYLLHNLMTGVERVYYRMEPSGQNVHYQLRVRRKIRGITCDIPMHHESKGIQRFVELFPALYRCSAGCTVLVDDLDAGIHPCLVPDMTSGGLEGSTGQFIATTHCTQLLEGTDPRYCYAISADMDGNKSVASFPSIERTMANHNNRIRYEKGVFGAVPCPGAIHMDVFISIGSEEAEER